MLLLLLLLAAGDKCRQPACMATNQRNGALLFSD